MTALALFANAVTLRGFLGRDAEIHASEPITEDAYAVLLLGTASGTWERELFRRPRISSSLMEVRITLDSIPIPETDSMGW